MVDTVIVAPEITTGEAPADHNQKMIDKANGITPSTDTPPNTDNLSGDRPAWLPEKFKTAEDMAKSYAELESQQSKGKTTEPAVEPTEVTPETLEIDATLKAKGLELSEFSSEYDKTGKISPESYEKLKAAGFSQDLVDSYVSGQEARAALHISSLKDSAGGSEAYSTMTTWAVGAMSPAEIAAFNSAVASSNVESSKLAIAGLKSRYEAANGRSPSLLTGKAGTAPALDVFESRAEMTTAMKDPRYAKDSAYRQQVINKVGRSTLR